MAGMHRSPLRGLSVEFAEHREYSPGDDLRYVDWKVFGRSDKFYLKQYEEETNLVCYLAVDTSASMGYRGPAAAMSKLEYAQRAAANLAYLVTRQQDSVALATFDAEVRQFVRPGRGAEHWRHVVESFDVSGEDRPTSIGPVLHQLAERFIDRGLVILISDLFDDVPKLVAGLKHLRHRRHDVIVLQVLDAAEIEFPFRRTTMFESVETDDEVLAHPIALRKAYLAEFGRFLDAVRRGCRELSIDHFVLRTDEPLADALSRFLAAREARSA
ncbi:MAG: DUF58 domain-containing protein [Planctomycetota bacterium]|nr:MAG: DUF58 domain-containing protein [Planctomycetota bacterium]